MVKRKPTSIRIKSEPPPQKFSSNLTDMDNLKQKFPSVFSFFEDSEFASTTFINKYVLKDKEGKILESDPTEII
jgi:hypothetical protein